MTTATDQFEPGQRVAVTQQIPQRDAVWTNRIEGEIVRYERRKTGSWFAHSKDDKLWLDRLVVRKGDGEVVMINLDRYTNVQSLPPEVKPPPPEETGDKPADPAAATEPAEAEPSA